jgi:hypothetical protein
MILIDTYEEKKFDLVRTKKITCEFLPEGKLLVLNISEEAFRF